MKRYSVRISYRESPDSRRAWPRVAGYRARYEVRASSARQAQQAALREHRRVAHPLQAGWLGLSIRRMGRAEVL